MDESRLDSADDKLAWSVRQALLRSEPIRALDMDNLVVEAKAGVVVLHGVLASEAHRYCAIQLARSVRGVKEVRSELKTDEELEREVAAALAAEGVRPHRVVVNVLGAVAHLYGVVTSHEEGERLRRVARAVPHVAGVHNHLHAVPEEALVLLAWQSSIEGRPQHVPGEDAPAEPAGSDALPQPAEPASPPVGTLKGPAR